jgi:hypothetical protein
MVTQGMWVAGDQLHMFDSYVMLRNCLQLHLVATKPDLRDCECYLAFTATFSYSTTQILLC